MHSIWHFHLAVVLAATTSNAFGADLLSVAMFQADATPPIGSPVAYVNARSITDPLSARGVVLIGVGKPIVLCAVDWIGIGNGGHDAWREALAAAAETTVDRVTVHTLHQHDGPRCDFTAEELLAAHGLRGTRFDVPFAKRAIAAAADAVRRATTEAKPVTHLGIGEAKVEKVASNRRILGPSGKVVLGRMSASRNPEVQAAPEGTIDPILKLISFWNGETPLVCLTYYATHPQSYYGQGDVTAEFVGLARAERERETDVPHVHFNGASGNVAAGKYNDGSPQKRPILAARMADGMRRAWEATVKTAIDVADVEWRSKPVVLPLGEHLQREPLLTQLSDAKAEPRTRLNAATKLAYLDRVADGRQIDVTCLRLREVYLLHLPGELFVEYQLAAQQMRPDATVCLAAYGDYGPGYIGTEIAYSQGGYETQASSSNTAPEVEKVLLDAMKQVLRRPNDAKP